MDSLSKLLEKKDDDVSGVLDRYRGHKINKQKMQRLTFQIKRPGLAQLLGDDSPMKSDELEEIKKLIRMKRETY